jgi:hypothetical protein
MIPATPTMISMRAFRARLRRYHIRHGTRIVFGRWADHIELADGRLAGLWRYPGGTEAYARAIGVLRNGETVDHSPKCSRCKTRTPGRRMQWIWADGDLNAVPVEPARYHRQCERCMEWSRETRRDPKKCLDCRRRIQSDLPVRFRIRRCDHCQNRKLNREFRARQIEGATNPNSPWFGSPMGRAYDR